MYPPPPTYKQSWGKQKIFLCHFLCCSLIWVFLTPTSPELHLLHTAKLSLFSHGLKHMLIAHLKLCTSNGLVIIISLFLANKLSHLAFRGEKKYFQAFATPTRFYIFYFISRKYQHENCACTVRRMSRLACLLIALTPLPSSINNTQRARLNIYEVYTALVRIQSKLSL